MSYQAIKRWDTITEQQFGRAIFDTVKGECLLLTKDCKGINSIWSKVALALGTRHKTAVDRFWCLTYYHTNKKNVQEIHRQICIENNVDYNPIQQVKVSLSKIHCVCKTSEDISDQPSMIACDNCDQWYHSLCQNIQTKAYENKSWICCDCQNVPIIKNVPLFARLEDQNLPSMSSPFKTAVSDVRIFSPKSESEISATVNSEVSNKQKTSIRPSPKRFKSLFAATGFPFRSSTPATPKRLGISYLSTSKNLFSGTNRSGLSTITENTENDKNVDFDSKLGSSDEDSWKNLPPVKVMSSKEFEEKRAKLKFDRDQQSKKSMLNSGFVARTPKRDGQPASRLSMIKQRKDKIKKLQKESKRYKKKASNLESDSESIESENDNLIDPFTNSKSSTKHQNSKDKIKQLRKRVKSKNERSFLQIVKASSNESDSASDKEFANADNERVKVYDGPFKDFKPFSIVIPWQEWTKIMPEIKNEAKDEGYKYRLKKMAWSMTFNSNFVQNCPSSIKGCKLTFHSHLVKNGSTDSYVTAKASCTRKFRKKQLCTMTYDFVLKSQPQDEDAIIQITPKGTLLHDLRGSTSRNCQGTLRNSTAVAVKNKKASVYVRELYGKKETDQEMIKKNNKTYVHSANLVRKVRFEQMAKLDRDKDPIVNLALLKTEMSEYEHLKGKYINGYIQNLSVFPFTVVLYTERQLEILRRILKFNNNTVLHLDATGSIATDLCEPYHNKRLFYYALVITLPNGEAPCIPVLKWITNRHDSIEIGHVLKNFFNSYQKYTNSQDRLCGIRRVETDNSLALISAMMSALNVGPISFFTVHKRKNNSALSKKPETLTLLQTWTEAYLVGKDMHSFCRRVKDLVFILGMERLTPQVLEKINNIDSPTVRGNSEPWRVVNLNEVKFDPPFYKCSPYGMYALITCKRKGIPLPKSMRRFDVPDGPEDMIQSKRNLTECEDLSCATNAEKIFEEEDSVLNIYPINPHYDVELLKYFLVHIFPLGGLLDHSLLTLNGGSEVPDTNAGSESWNAILKIDELQRANPIKAGRFIIFEEEILRGRFAMFEAALEVLERIQKGYKQQLAKTSQKQRRLNITTEHKPIVRAVAKKSTSGIRKLLNQTKKLSGETSKETPLKTINTTPKRSSFRRPTDHSSLILPEEVEEDWRKHRGKVPALLSQPRSVIHGLPLIPYGGHLVHEGKQIKVYNTCNIDSVLQILYVMYKTIPAIQIYFQRFIDIADGNIAYFLRVFRFLDRFMFDEARDTTVKRLLELSTDVLLNGDFYGSEQRMVDCIKHLIVLVQNIKCENPDCELPKQSEIYPVEVLDASDVQGALLKYNSKVRNKQCDGCATPKPLIYYEWTELSGSPPFLVIVLGVGTFTEVNIERSIPLTVVVLGQRYYTFAYTVRYKAHFTSVFIVNKQKYIYDGLDSSSLKLHQPYPKGHTIGTVWFIRSIS